MRSTDYVTPFIDCLNDESVSGKAQEIAVSGLHHILSYNLASEATTSTIIDILNDRVGFRALIHRSCALKTHPPPLVRASSRSSP